MEDGTRKSDGIASPQKRNNRGLISSRLKDGGFTATLVSAKSVAGKISQAQAGYMELRGAVKSGYCRVVEGRVSGELGCSNMFLPSTESADRFDCANCLYYEGEGEKGEE